MYKAFKFRLYPSKEQATLINKSIGCSRFTFNHFLAKWNEQYEQTGKGLTYNACSKWLTELKKEREWLREVDSTSLQNALKNLTDAFSRFFKKQNDRPRFKSRKHPVQSYTSQCNYPKNGKPTMEAAGNKLKLPKLGYFLAGWQRERGGTRSPPPKIWLINTRDFVSLLCERNACPCPYVPVNSEKAVGVDLGLKDFAIFSDGTKVNAPKSFRKYEKKLAHWQRILSRRQKGGSNWHKARVKVAKIHEKIVNARRTFCISCQPN